MRYYVLINNAEYEVEVDKGKVGVISTREVHQVCGFSDALHRPWQRQKPAFGTSTGACTCRDAAANTGQAARPAPLVRTAVKLKAPMPEPY